MKTLIAICICFVLCLSLWLEQSNRNPMALKYQNEIDAFALDINCPSEVYPPDELTAYRWSIDPLNHALNFVPNVVFDRAKNIPFPYHKKPAPIKCRRCGASYFTNIQGALDKWEILSLQNKLNLGYTRIAKGILNAEDGVMRHPEADGHFGFYEDEAADLVLKFELIDDLNVES